MDASILQINTLWYCLAIYSGFTHSKWWFSIVLCLFTRPGKYHRVGPLVPHSLDTNHRWCSVFLRPSPSPTPWNSGICCWVATQRVHHGLSTELWYPVWCLIHFSIENVMWGILHSCMKPYLSLLLGELGDVGRDLRGALLRVVEHLGVWTNSGNHPKCIWVCLKMGYTPKK